jgi:hypothetical protein
LFVCLFSSSFRLLLEDAALINCFFKAHAIYFVYIPVAELFFHLWWKFCHLNCPRRLAKIPGFSSQIWAVWTTIHLENRFLTFIFFLYVRSYEDWHLSWWALTLSIPSPVCVNSKTKFETSRPLLFCCFRLYLLRTSFQL